MSEAKKAAATKLAGILSAAARNAKGAASTAAGVALIALGVFMAWKLDQLDTGLGVIVLGIGFVFTRDQAEAAAVAAEPVEKINGGGSA